MATLADVLAAQLRPHEVKSLRILARRSTGGFERLGAMPGVGQSMIDQMVERGLAEQGVFNQVTAEVGYRLSQLGSEVIAALAARPKAAPSGLSSLQPRASAAPSPVGRKRSSKS